MFRPINKTFSAIFNAIMLGILNFIDYVMLGVFNY